jgi:hypothetical protein
MKNLENIKKLAEKEGIEISDLVKILKKWIVKCTGTNTKSHKMFWVH